MAQLSAEFEVRAREYAKDSVRREAQSGAVITLARGPDPPPGAPRQGRHHRGDHASSQLPAASHRARAPAHRDAGARARRRSTDPGAERGRGAPPHAHSGPEPGLPTDERVGLNVERCPETYRHDVPRHHRVHQAGRYSNRLDGLRQLLEDTKKALGDIAPQPGPPLQDATDGPTRKGVGRSLVGGRPSPGDP